MSNLRNSRVALSNLGVKGHLLGLVGPEVDVSSGLVPGEVGGGGDLWQCLELRVHILPTGCMDFKPCAPGVCIYIPKHEYLQIEICT